VAHVTHRTPILTLSLDQTQADVSSAIATLTQRQRLRHNAKRNEPARAKAASDVKLQEIQADSIPGGSRRSQNELDTARNKLETAIATLNAADKDVIASQASVNQAQSNVNQARNQLPPIK